ANFTDLGPQIQDWTDTGTIMKELDLVLTSCTAPAHLAGAMARPVWVVLPFMPDYRWLLKREDTPWYPTMRLFRQTDPGQWGPIMSKVVEALRDKVANRG